MAYIKWLFDTRTVAFSIMAYPMSYIELMATLFGLISVYLAARNKVATWPTGIVNEIALFFLFFQVQLYADMLLQVFFLVVTIFGWYNWRRPGEETAVGRLSANMVQVYLASLVSGTLLTGIVIQYVHVWLPAWLPQPTTYPYADSFVMVASILATFLLAKRRLETWVLWIAVDIVSILLYYIKGLNFLALEYLIFLGLAIAGLLEWRKKLRYA